MIQELFAACLNLSSEQWEQKLHELCPEDAAVRSEVLELLRADVANQRDQHLVASDVPAAARAWTELDWSASPPVLGRYQLIRQVGHGSSGIVFEARAVNDFGAESTDTAPRFAVKLLHPWLRDENSFARFAAEAQALKSLDHPHVARFVEAGQEGEFRFLVMEFIDGQCLSERLKDTAGNYQVAQVPLEQRVKWFRMICQGVSAAHQQLLLHRDLKPSNVLIDSDGNAVLTDFGLVKFLEPKLFDHVDERLIDLTSTGQTPGTLLFMAPEQLDGSGQLGLATDVYGLGATLYFPLTGKPPYFGRSAVDVCQTIRSGPPALIRTVDPSVPKDLQAICFKCLSASPGRRYQTAQALEEDVTRYIAGEPIVARRIGSLETASYWLLRNPVQALLAIGLLTSMLLGLGLTSFFWLKAERNFAEAEAAKADLFQTISEVTGHLRSVESDPRTLPLQREMLISIAQGYDRLAVYTELTQRQQNNHGVAWFKLGRVENQMGDNAARIRAYEQAERIFKRQADEEPNNLEWHFDHFHALTSLSKNTEALAAIERVIELDEAKNISYSDAYVNALLELARENLEAGQLDQAEHYARRSRERAEQHLRQHPEDPRFFRKLAQQCFLDFQLAAKRRRLTEMLEYLDQACSLIEDAHHRNHNDAGVRNELLQYRLRRAKVACLRKQYDQARIDLDFAESASLAFLTDFPTYKDAWLYRADTLWWQLNFCLCIDDPRQLARVRDLCEQLIAERLATKPNCFMANCRLAMLVACPSLQDVPDIARANAVLALAKTDPLAPSLQECETYLKLWNGQLEEGEPELDYWPILGFYLRAIKNLDMDLPEPEFKHVTEMNSDMTFEFAQTYTYLLPAGFGREVHYARAKQLEASSSSAQN